MAKLKVEHIEAQAVAIRNFDYIVVGSLDPIACNLVAVGTGKFEVINNLEFKEDTMVKVILELVNSY